MESNSSILSGNSRYKPTLNVNGELDILCKTQQIWSTNTANSNATKLHFKDDGNLVLYKKDGSNAWATNTRQTWWNDPKPGKLVIQDDGNLVLYLPNNEVAWASHSSFNCQNGEYRSRKIDLIILSCFCPFFRPYEDDIVFLIVRCDLLELAKGMLKYFLIFDFIAERQK